MAQIDDRSHITAEQFEGLKDELERLLYRNRGLTRAPTAAGASSSSRSSRSSSARDRDTSVHSRHSSSHSQSSSCSSFSGVLLGHSGSQPVSAAEQASQQLNHDVDILLKQVDSVMAAPVLQLPAWFTKKPAAPSCTVTELPQADQTQPASQSAHSAHKIVTPKLKANSVSTADSHTCACQDNQAAESTATSAAEQQPTKAHSASSAAWSQSKGTAALPDIGTSLSSTAAAVHMVAREPDNLTILHVACSTTPSQSDDTTTTTKSGRQAQADALPSPKEWHTNHMADSDGSVGSTADSTEPAAASSVAAAAAAWSADSSARDADIAVMHAARRSRRRNGFPDTSKGQSHRSKTSNSHRAPACTEPKSPGQHQDELTDPEHDQNDLHMENVAPGWHRQPLQNLRKSDAASAKVAQPEGNTEAETAGGSAGQGGLMEGYLRGSSAKLQLPASVRTGSRKGAITARTPLKTITEVYRQHSMERFDIDRSQHVSQAPSRLSPADPPCASAPTQADTASEVLPPQGRTSAAEGSPQDASVSSEDRAKHSALPSEGRAQAPALPLESSMDAWGMAYGRGGGVMAGGMEGLQAVLQDNSTALQQELRTAEAKMEAMLSQLTSGRSGAQLRGVPSSHIPQGASVSDMHQQLANAERQIARLTDDEQRLQAQITQLGLDLQHSSSLLSRSEQNLQCKSDQLQQVQQQLSSCMALSSAAQQQLHSNTVQESQADMLQQVTAQQQDQQQQSGVAAAPAAMASGESHTEAAAAVEALQEAEMLREKLHDSVELLEEADRQLQLKVAEVDEYRAGMTANQQELQQTRLQLQERQALLEEHAELLQQHNVQLLQAQEELQVSQSRCEAMEEQLQAAAEGYAKKEGQLQSALERLQLLAQQSQSERGLARGGPDGRLQAAQARCNRAEARLTSQQVKTQQVSQQLAGKCAELVQSQSELRQAHHMLAAAYAANAALQVRVQHRGRSTVDDSPEQRPATPLAPSVPGSPHESNAAVTPAASLQAPGSGSNRLVAAKGSSWPQPLLAAALARAAEGSSPSAHSTVAGNSPARASALLASAAGAVEPNSPRSRASLRPVAGATQEAAAAAGNLAQARNPSLSSGEQPAALSRQEDATSSASFDSWHSRNHGDSTTTASSKPADATAVGPSRHSGSKIPIAAAAIDAQEAKAKDRHRKACRTQQLLAQVQQACLTPGSVHSSSRARGGAHTQGGTCSDLWGQGRFPRGQQLTPGRQLPEPALTPPATQGMWGSTLQLTPASQQGSTGPSLFFGDDSSAARGVATFRRVAAAAPTIHDGMHVSGRKKASRLGNDTTTALANALSGIW